jgi:hypothetical protein
MQDENRKKCLTIISGYSSGSDDWALTLKSHSPGWLATGGE